MGEALNIAGEEMTGKDMAALWQKINGKESPSVRYKMIPRILIYLLEHDIGLMANWIERAGYGADLKELKVLADELEINMTPLSSWLREKTSERTPPKKSTVFDLKKRFVPAT